MNLESDTECTCDVGIFATCPACIASDMAQLEMRIADRKERAKYEKPERKLNVLSPLDMYNLGKYGEYK